MLPVLNVVSRVALVCAVAALVSCSSSSSNSSNSNSSLLEESSDTSALVVANSNAADSVTGFESKSLSIDNVADINIYTESQSLSTEPTVTQGVDIPNVGIEFDTDGFLSFDFPEGMRGEKIFEVRLRNTEQKIIQYHENIDAIEILYRASESDESVDLIIPSSYIGPIYLAIGKVQ